MRRCRFRIVGRLKGDQLKHRGQVYLEMTQPRPFPRATGGSPWAERGPTSCTLVLSDDAETRTRYPFPFRPYRQLYGADKARIYHAAYW